MTRRAANSLAIRRGYAHQVNAVGGKVLQQLQEQGKINFVGRGEHPLFRFRDHKGVVKGGQKLQ